MHESGASRERGMGQSVAFHRLDNDLVIYLSGKFEEDQVDVLDRALEDAFCNSKSLIVDLTAVEQIADVALYHIADTASHARVVRGQLRLVGASPMIRRQADQAGLTGLFNAGDDDFSL